MNARVGLLQRLTVPIFLAGTGRRGARPEGRASGRRSGSHTSGRSRLGVPSRCCSPRLRRPTLTRARGTCLAHAHVLPTTMRTGITGDALAARVVLVGDESRFHQARGPLVLSEPRRRAVATTLCP